MLLLQRDYRIAENFRGRKLSRISRLCGYTRNFSLRNLGRGVLRRGKSEQSAKVFSENRIFTNSRKFSPSNVSCYNCIQLSRKRNHHFRKAKHSGDRDDYLKFRQVRNRVVAELRLAKRRFFANLYIPPQPTGILENSEIFDTERELHTNSV